APRPKDVVFEAIKVPLGMVDSFGGESSSLAMDFVNDTERQILAEAEQKDVASMAESARKKLLRVIAEDGTLIQADYAARSDINRSSIVRYMQRLRKDHYLSGKTGNLKVSPKGMMWCKAEGSF
ncbi:MAG: hypothetical protein DRI24_17965, partial [Deltaproteobacteria bacterium]